jgi:hypothetical protein
MVSPEKQVAREVHELLLEARPQTDDANLARAAEITLSPDLVSHNDFREQFSISHLLFNATKEALDFLRPPQLAASFIQSSNVANWHIASVIAARRHFRS